jgi:transposase
MKAYSMEFRQSVVAARESGMPAAEVCELFGCSESWVRRLRQRQRETGSLEPCDRQAPDQRKVDEQQRERLRTFIRERPDATLAELIEDLELPIHAGTLSRLLKAMNLPLKKSPTAPASRIVPTSRRPAPVGWSSSGTCD